VLTRNEILDRRAQAHSVLSAGRPGFPPGRDHGHEPDGDSDPNGSITGSLPAKLYGAHAVPQTWLEPLGLRSAIMEIAETRTTSSSLEKWLHYRDGNGQKVEDRISASIQATDASGVFLRGVRSVASPVPATGSHRALQYLAQMTCQPLWQSVGALTPDCSDKQGAEKPYPYPDEYSLGAQRHRHCSCERWD